MPGHVDHFPDKVEPGNLAAFHRTRTQLRGVDTTCCDLRLVVAFGPGGMDGPVVERGLSFFDALIGPRGRRPLRQPTVGKAMGKNVAERGAGAAQITLRCLGTEWSRPELIWRQVDYDRLAGLPVGRNLQHGGPTEAAVSKEELFSKAPGSRRRDHLGRNSRQAGVA